MGSRNINIGIDESTFTKIGNYFANNLLYYSGSILTNKNFIKNPVLHKDGEFFSSGEHTIYVYQHVKKGAFLSTCAVKGCAFKTDFEEIAFAIALEDSWKPTDRNADYVEKVRVKFLQR